MMRRLRFLFIMFVGFLAFVFLFSLFLPSVGHTERAGIIEAPLDTVMSRLTDVHLLARWMQGWSTDSVDRSLEFQFADNLAHQNSCFSWYHRGLAHRRGSFCITHIGNRQVDYRMDMPGLPFITGHFIVAPALDNTHTWIKWTMDMQLGWWPWWKYYGVMLDRLVGPGMEHALGSLKVDCEQADTLGYQIQRILVPFHAVLTWADTLYPPRVDRYRTLQQGYQQLEQYLRAHNLSQQQAVIAQFVDGPAATLYVHVGIPLSEPVPARLLEEQLHGGGRIQQLVMPEGGFVLVASYAGQARHIKEAYQALQAYLHKQHLQSPAGPWEQYLQDQLPEHDTSQVNVRVYWPVY